MNRGILLLLLLASIGCQESVDPAWLVTEPRLIGLTATVVGAEDDRVTPRPGETVELRLLFAQPDASRVRPSWGYAACQPAVTSGSAGCEGPPFAFAIEGDPELGDRPLSITIPEGYEAARVLIIGAVCMNGRINPSFDMSAAPDPSAICRDEGMPQVMAFTHPVAVEARIENRAPQMASITLGGEPWTHEPPPGAGGGPCVGDGYPELAMGSEGPMIEVRVRDGDLEPYMTFGPSGELEPRVEEVFIETLATAGTLQRRFSFITEDDPVADIRFTPEDDRLSVPAEGLLVPVWLLARDQRGGFDFAIRAVCLRP
ncbi:MAG: hypothetical protein KF901_32440 [Myxococcales bacterium]|nr:hypothetical protein [Myxococcales bacterium]